MSQSDVNCRKCKAKIGVRHHGGRLHVAETVAVERHGRVLRIVCACGEEREWAA